MKFIKPFLIAGAIALTLPSCFLFRSSHESCPAYGQEIKQQNNDKDIIIDNEEVQNSQKA